MSLGYASEAVECRELTGGFDRRRENSTLCRSCCLSSSRLIMHER